MDPTHSTRSTTISSASLPLPSYAKSLLAAPPSSDPLGVSSTITALSLQPHPEGGFFSETDRDPHLIPNPFLGDTNPRDYATTAVAAVAATAPVAVNGTNFTSNSGVNPNAEAYNFSLASKSAESPFRHASTTIHYYLTPQSPLGRFHRNKARTVQTLHWGRGAYVVLHPPSASKSNIRGGEGGGEERKEIKWRVETFIVGKDVASGERVQWIVEGGRYKASYLMDDEAEEDELSHEDKRVCGRGKGTAGEQGLLISETVVPGFEYSDHDFLTAGEFKEIVSEGQWKVMGWLLGGEEVRKLSGGRGTG